MLSITDHLIQPLGDPIARNVSAAEVERLVSTLPKFRMPVSGTVYGTLLNDRLAVDALGDAVNAPPYKAAPKAPILYVKPANTLVGHGAEVTIPDEAGVQVGGSLGIVIGRTASHVSESHALEVVAGYTVVADLCVPHESVYRPSVRFRARDGFCVAGPAIVKRDFVAQPDSLQITTSVDGLAAFNATTASSVRGVARLIADVTEFMTLHPGDVLTMGVPHGSPVSLHGGSARVSINGLPTLEFTLRVSAQKGEV
ncbi:fumarylacetoacetate hydrolase family protein [Paraburkholderia sp. CNPSo 3281]|uniref:fumarylacetoacetate hydrolase family protein n=1 Tax=Paraburkholderia sp. CNPSo 3281 TaxID=2940933 RepID=UPI0020B74147|nr:fumarylacetoacetate hydrolase family protein [Paraburkholderia sp. CNPSo 3281]MCP3721013.1 fumarylacetoacetate hydrolase family protein [Paraburkholderia sp. CNPSo 3281]